MLRGMYTAASEMLTEKRALNTIGNNLANVSTTGYKSQTMITSTFRDMVLDRADYTTREDRTRLNNSSVRRIVSEEVTDYTEGTLKATDSRFDFAILGDGFFRVQTPQNGMIYTRDGSFTLDNQRYLSLAGIGRVLDAEGNPIFIESEYFEAMSDGTILMQDINGQYIDSGKDGQPLSAKIGLYTFANPDSLIKFDAGLFKSDDAPILVQNPAVRWKTLELSNVDTLRETINMITAQRSLQSCSQIVKIYDQLLEKAVDLGKIQ